MAQGSASEPGKKPDRANAYYHFAMGHLYAELAGNYGNRGEYLNQAIDHYKQAIAADPGASILSEELSELYVQAGRLREAVTGAEEALKQNPDDLSARRILARIYTRLIGDQQQGKIKEDMLKRAIEQYRKITEMAPQDVNSWLMLGRLEKVAQNSVESEKAYKKVLELEPENEDALTGIAMVYADVGDTRRAAEMLSRAAEKTPSLRTLAALASAYEQMRDYENAASTLRRAIEMAPQNPELKRALAQNLLLSGKLDESLALYQEMASEDPKDASLQLRISQIFRQQRKFDKAHEASRKAKEIDPESVEIRYNEVNLLEAEGKQQEAIDALKQILASSAKRSYTVGEKANRGLLLERLGYLHRMAEQFPQAVEVFREMEALDSEQAARARIQVIETYRQAREFTKAWEEAELALQKFPADRNVKITHAYIAADTGRGEVAARNVKSLFGGKNDRETWLALAQIYEKTKSYAEMGKALDEADKLSGDKEEKEGVAFMRGAMLEKMKQFDAAEKEFRQILADSPDNASALNYLGYMLADRNVRLQEAHELIAKALELDPHNGAYLDSMGWVLYRMGKIDEAVDYLERALQRTSRDPTVHDHLGDAYLRQGKVKEAMTQWEKSLREWEASPVSERDNAEVAKVQKKLDGAKVRVAKESGKKE